MTEFEQRVRRKARLRRGKSRQNEKWLAETRQRASTQHYNQRRITNQMHLTGEMSSVQDWLRTYFYESEDEEENAPEETTSFDEKNNEGQMLDMQSKAEQIYRSMTDDGRKLAEWKKAWAACERLERNGGVWTPNVFASTLVAVAHDTAGFVLPETVARAIYANLDTDGSRLLGTDALMRAVDAAMPRAEGGD